LVSWQVGDLELLAHHGDDPVEFGMYPMAPWAGRVRDNELSVEDLLRMGFTAEQSIALPVNHPPWALHGTCFTSPVDSMVATQDTVISRQVIPQWPWPAELINTWTIHHDGINITSTVHAAEPTPVILGWHPWFRRSLRGSSAQWSMKAATVSVRSDSLPTGEWLNIEDTSGPYDDVFHCPDQRVDITWPGVLSLTVHSTHPWFVVFDEQPDAICVEPQTQIPNAWREPLGGEADIASPGSDVDLTTRWRFALHEK
jgi:aldose 1-epimerase